MKDARLAVESDPPAGHGEEAAVEALESDLAYFRTKRLEPRVVQLLRRGALSFADLVGFRPTRRQQLGGDRPGTDHARVRALQDRLDAYILDVAAIDLPCRTATLVIEDVRKERGDYDAFFRFHKPAHPATLGERIDQLEAEMAGAQLVVDAVTAALVGRGELDAEAVGQRRAQRSALGSRNGARIVARAWSDPAFKQRLLENGREALRDLDVPTGRIGRLAVAENTDEVHNVVVCTLCSCYPHDVLGDPPWWYRSDEYKQRIVDDPRSALAEMFGLTIAGDRKVRVHDSTSDLRWMVLPRRPAATDGWGEEDLAALVTAESLVGVSEPQVRA